MTNWETITKPKNQGGLGIKKFGPMNKALITKQYWRIRNNPNLLLSKTLKSKYCPNPFNIFFPLIWFNQYIIHNQNVKYIIPIISTYKMSSFLPLGIIKNKNENK
jgi:hypothetical protein